MNIFSHNKLGNKNLTNAFVHAFNLIITSPLDVNFNKGYVSLHNAAHLEENTYDTHTMFIL